jgi:hypothetical protein
MQSQSSNKTPTFILPYFIPFSNTSSSSSSFSSSLFFPNDIFYNPSQVHMVADRVIEQLATTAL